MCNLLNQASVKITENTTNETLELELKGTNRSVSSDQPLTIRLEGAHEPIMALKEIYQIKIWPLPTRWRHHDMSTVTENKIEELSEPDFEGPPTLSDVTAAFDGIYLGLQKYDYVSFPRPIGCFPASHKFWYHENSDTGRKYYPNCQYLSKKNKPLMKSNSENNVPNGSRQLLSTCKV